MRTEIKGQQETDMQKIPAAPVFEQRACRVELTGWACLTCGASVETSGRVLAREGSVMKPIKEKKTYGIRF